MHNRVSFFPGDEAFIRPQKGLIFTVIIFGQDRRLSFMKRPESLICL
jgi:hypothetical protein